MMSRQSRRISKCHCICSRQGLIRYIYKYQRAVVLEGAPIIDSRDSQSRSCVACQIWRLAARKLYFESVYSHRKSNRFYVPDEQHRLPEDTRSFMPILWMTVEDTCEESCRRMLYCVCYLRLLKQNLIQDVIVTILIYLFTLTITEHKEIQRTQKDKKRKDIYSI